jgi:hypothetical protein
VTIQEQLVNQGWALTTGAQLGWPAPEDMQAAFAGALADDPRGPGKQHARDVIRHHSGAMTSAASIAFTTASGEVIDDFSRIDLLGPWFGKDAARQVLYLIPPAERPRSGAISADYFRYSGGARSAAHRDGHGSYVAIWVLEQAESGGESFLITEGGFVFKRALVADEVLIFRDDMFLHGAEPAQGRRDVLIFITLKP